MTEVPLLPLPRYFQTHSTLHGRLHVARVMVLGFRLLEVTGNPELEIPLWAAIFVHDLGRRHDGHCEQHGKWAVDKIQRTPVIRKILTHGGLRPEHWPMIATAVIHHCQPAELAADHPHRRLTALLKDADGLDRVRLGDLDPSYLRHKEAHALIAFAEALFQQSRQLDAAASHLLQELWDIAATLSPEANRDEQ